MSAPQNQGQQLVAPYERQQNQQPQQAPPQLPQPIFVPFNQPQLGPQVLSRPQSQPQSETTSPNMARDPTPNPQTRLTRTLSMQETSKSPTPGPNPVHPEIRSLVQLDAAHRRKIYYSGPLIRKLERQADGQNLTKTMDGSKSGHSWAEIF